MSDNALEKVHIFQGHRGEQVPSSVEKLIVNKDVQVLPMTLCYNYKRLRQVILLDGLIGIDYGACAGCPSLLEIKICCTVQYIGEKAFWECTRLTKVDFEFSAYLPHHLERIDALAFSCCSSLARIKLPASVTTVGQSVFDGCHALVVANLSTTGVTKISEGAFSDCPSLQTVSLPHTLEWIDGCAFYGCVNLVTVVVPLDSSPQPIRIGVRSFGECRQLANIALPKDSATTGEDSFENCTLLYSRFGKRSTDIVAGLIGRFDDFPVHEMCYDHSRITSRGLRQFTKEQEEAADSFVDIFALKCILPLNASSRWKSSASWSLPCGKNSSRREKTMKSKSVLIDKHTDVSAEPMLSFRTLPLFCSSLRKLPPSTTKSASERTTLSS